MKTDLNRRKIVNLRIDPEAQLRFAKPFVILLLVSFLVINSIFWQIHHLRDAASDTTYAGVIGPLSGLMKKIILVSSLGMALLGVLSLVFWIIYSRRLFGPAVALHRQIKAISEGNYEARCHLRKNDEFKELAEDLNRLAEILKSRG